MRTTTSKRRAVLSWGVDQEKSIRCAMSWHLHLMQIPQVASTVRLGWRVFCAKPLGGDEK